MLQEDTVARPKGRLHSPTPPPAGQHPCHAGPGLSLAQRCRLLTTAKHSSPVGTASWKGTSPPQPQATAPPVYTPHLAGQTPGSLQRAEGAARAACGEHGGGHTRGRQSGCRSGLQVTCYVETTPSRRAGRNEQSCVGKRLGQGSLVLRPLAEAHSSCEGPSSTQPWRPYPSRSPILRECPSQLQ